jgi:hypothetical protein
MTVQICSQSLPVAAHRPRQSFWRRLLEAIMESQQRKAEQVLHDYPPGAGSERRDGFSRDLERWYVGQ